MVEFVIPEKLGTFIQDKKVRNKNEQKERYVKGLKELHTTFCSVIHDFRSYQASFEKLAEITSTPSKKRISNACYALTAYAAEHGLEDNFVLKSNASLSDASLKDFMKQHKNNLHAYAKENVKNLKNLDGMFNRLHNNLVSLRKQNNSVLGIYNPSSVYSSASLNKTRAPKNPQEFVFQVKKQIPEQAKKSLIHFAELDYYFNKQQDLAKFEIAKKDVVAPAEEAPHKKGSSSFNFLIAATALLMPAVAGQTKDLQSNLNDLKKTETIKQPSKSIVSQIHYDKVK